MLSPLSPMSPNTFSQQYSETPDMQHLQLSNDQLVRRNSMCLCSPPTKDGLYSGSLAAEILNTGSSDNINHYSKAKSILSNLKEMADRYSNSDFASCDSSFSSGPDSEDGFQSMDRRKKSRKHRLSISPNKEDTLMKKPNTAWSPNPGDSL